MRPHTFNVPPETPRLYATDKIELKDKTVHFKLFDPCGRFTAYGFEYDPEERLGFGYIVSPLGPECDEMGYFSLDKIRETRNRLGLYMEQDLYFTPKPLSKLVNLD